jgi:tetratricopeptide (TPR) repeat protein
MQKLIIALGCWLLCPAWQTAAAQSTRVVLLAEEQRDGRVQHNALLEAAANAALQTRGLRVVELDAALSAQRLLLAASLEQGKVPRELTVLNADAVLSLRLTCDQSSAAVLGSALLAYYCVLGSKVVRLDTGDIAFSDSVELTGHGLNAAMAVQSMLKARARKVLHEQAERWLASLHDADRWEVDLVVTRLSDRATASALAAHLADLPGIDAARAVLWNRGTAKYALSGRGRLALGQVADALDSNPDLALTVTYQVDRALHAEYDFAKAYRRKVMVMSVAAFGSENAELGAQVVNSALMNLPYLEIAHSRPLLAAPESERELAQRLRDKAVALGVPLMVVCGFTRESDGWTAGMRLLHVASGRTVAAATGDGAGLAEAADRVVRTFDERFRAALSHQGARVRLGLESATITRISASGLVIRAFRIPERTAAASGVPRDGVIEIVNTSRESIEDMRMTIEAAGRPVIERPVPALAPGGSLVLSLPLAAVEVGDDGHVAVAAAISFRQGERRGLASAFASLIVERGAADAAAPTSARLQYDELMQTGLVHALHGEWEQARAAYARAHELHPDARTLHALGLLAFDLGQREQAARWLSEALVHRVRPLTDQQRREVETVLARLR